MKKHALALALALGLTPGLASAQGVLRQVPYGVTSTNASGALAATDTFQSLFAAVTINPAQVGRTSCTIQNNSTHSMYVFFGPLASATKTNSYILPAAGVLSCQLGFATRQDQVSIAGTQNDAFYAEQE